MSWAGDQAKSLAHKLLIYERTKKELAIIEEMIQREHKVSMSPDTEQIKVSVK